MSGYTRFISYIYTYEHGQRMQNSGFARVESRNGECKIGIHLKGFYTRGQAPYKAYLFVRKNDFLNGIFLGELKNSNGALEWRGTGDSEALFGSSCTLSETGGIFILGTGERVFATEWDDNPIDVRRIRMYEQEPEIAAAEKEGLEDEKFQELLKELEEPSSPEEPERTFIPAAEPEPCVKKNPMPEEEQKPQAQPEPAHTEEPPKEKDPYAEKWSYLERHYPSAMPFEGTARNISCIRLGPRDLSSLPRDAWILGNNSFLLHGYYQYRHLLLCRQEGEEKNIYFLGVPGIYNHKEQTMASMFGFEEFRPSGSPMQRQSTFGYWCKSI